MRKPVKLHFSDFWDGFRPRDYLLYRIIAEEFDVTLDPISPDVVIFADYGHAFGRYDCARIHVTGENILPDLNLCDYAIGPAFLTCADRYFRLPPFVWDPPALTGLADRPPLTRDDLAEKTRFCNFIYSNPNAHPMRDRLFHTLSKRWKIESSGRHLNNAPAPISDRFADDWRRTKIPYMAQFRFTIAVENSLGEGYTSEKILHAFLAGTVPIYWGNPEIGRDFNLDAMVNVHDFEKLADVVAEIDRLERDPDALLAKLNAPLFTDRPRPEVDCIADLRAFLVRSLSQPAADLRRRPRFGRTMIYENDHRRMTTDRGLPGLARRFVRRIGQRPTKT